jgi:hypothetical protein
MIVHRNKLTQIELVQSTDDYDETDGDFAHGEHVLDFDETFHAGVVDESQDTFNTRNRIVIELCSR